MPSGSKARSYGARTLARAPPSTSTASSRISIRPTVNEHELDERGSRRAARDPARRRGAGVPGTVGSTGLWHGGGAARARLLHVEGVGRSAGGGDRVPARARP